MSTLSFIGIGAEKCATTWCWHALKEHPEVCVSKPKELDYFNEKYDRGETWYLSHFAQSERRVWGEISPLYMSVPGVADRIAHDFPNVDILVVLRAPIARALSHLMMDIREVGSVSTLTAATARAFASKDGKYIERSLYYRALVPFYRRFEHKRIKVLFYEDLVEDARGFASNLYSAVGVADTFVPSVLGKKINQASDYRFMPVFRSLRSLGHAAKANSFTRPLLEWSHRAHISTSLLYWLRADRGVPRFSPNDIFSSADLSRLQEDTAALAEFGLVPPHSWNLSV